MRDGLARRPRDSAHRPRAYPEGEVFPGEDLCPGCVNALGEESWRAFEHPQPGDARGCTDDGYQARPPPWRTSPHRAYVMTSRPVEQSGTHADQSWSKLRLV